MIGVSHSVGFARGAAPARVLALAVLKGKGKGLCVCACVCVCVCVCVCAGAVRAALNDHNVERARAPKHRERRRAPPPRALAWVGSTRCGAQHALSCVAPAVAEPTAARTGAEWLPDRARQAQSHLRGANANRAVAVRRSRQPPAASRTAVQPSAVSSQSPSLPPPQQQRASSCVALPTQCGRAPPSGERACSELGRRARGRTAPVNRQPCTPTHST